MFDTTKVPTLQDFLCSIDSANIIYYFVKIPACFPIPYGYHVVQGPITKKTTANILNHISGNFWLVQIQEQVHAHNATESLLQNSRRTRPEHGQPQNSLWASLRMKQKISPKVLWIECMSAWRKKHIIPDPIQTNTKGAKGDNVSLTTEDNLNKPASNTTSLQLPASKDTIQTTVLHIFISSLPPITNKPTPSALCNSLTSQLNLENWQLHTMHHLSLQHSYKFSQHCGLRMKLHLQENMLASQHEHHFEGYVIDGQFCINGFHSFVDGEDLVRFNILTLIPLSSTTAPMTFYLPPSGMKNFSAKLVLAWRLTWLYSIL